MMAMGVIRKGSRPAGIILISFLKLILIIFLIFYIRRNTYIRSLMNCCISLCRIDYIILFYYSILRVPPFPSPLTCDVLPFGIVVERRKIFL